jgi:AmmeMemoRadiSam system protein B
MNDRQMSVAGTFYPAQCSEINRYIDTFNEALEVKADLDFTPRAVISPHAGYVYSGFTANAAYALIDTAKIKRVLVIGPSHRVYLRGASVALYEDYASPCGELKIDQKYSKALIDRYDALTFEPSAHSEHSTETQIPFIQHYFADVSLVEIVYGDIDYRELVPVIEDALRDEETFVVISTDLSHFYSLKEANRLDSVCLKAVEEMNLDGLNAGCEACGMIGVKAVTTAAKSVGMQSKLIDYRTSYDASSDADSVVGYMSVLLG